MNKVNKYIIVCLTAVLMLTASCTDEFKFGSAFLEKAPSGDVTKDTVFNSAEYTKQFLAGIYTLQYYGLPYRRVNAFPYTYDNYSTKFDCFTDCYLSNFTNESGSNQYYNGTLTSANSYQSDMLFDYRYNNTFEAIRAGWILIENVDNVPDLSEELKKQYKAEAKCLIAAKYFDAFKFYGGMPIIKGSFSGSDASYELPRGTVEETVNFIDQLLTEAAPDLPWKFENPTVDAGHWTQASALALRCKLWQFAASPLFNSATGYHGGDTEAEQKNLVWWGGYKPELWNKLLEVCNDFFNKLNANGGYALEQATANGTGGTIRPQDYCNAYRHAYYLGAGSSEVLHFTRVNNSDAFKSSTYAWHQWQGIGRCSTNPTFEYMCKFGWADGTPFDWENMTDEDKDQMFTKGGGDATKVVYTRDPRLYETMLVCGEATAMDAATGNLSGRMREMWVGGGESGVAGALGGAGEAAFAQQSITETQAQMGTGLGNQKYYCNADGLRNGDMIQWTYLRLADIILTYAEAKLQTGDLSGAITEINKVRSRVGLKGIEKAYPAAANDKDVLLEKLLDERVCEMGLEDTRYFDLIRYKRADILQKPIHKLLTWRIKEGGNRNNPDDISQNTWFGTDQAKGIPYPTVFKYETAVVKRTRIWWTQGYDPKWYLQPWPMTEINKGYGLIQNPGW